MLAVLAHDLFGQQSQDNLLAVLILSLIFWGVFMLHRVVARGALEGMPWSRTASRVIAVLMLFGVPIGTFIGLYLLLNTRKARWQPSNQLAPAG
jgi:hypothetical protein